MADQFQWWYIFWGTYGVTYLVQKQALKSWTVVNWAQILERVYINLAFSITELWNLLS